MVSIVMTEFQKIKRAHILLIGMTGMTLSPILGLLTQAVAIEEARIQNFDIGALVDSTLWNNATIFMPVLFTLIGGYLIRREYTDDTLKNSLTVPVSFSALLAGKLIAVGLLSVALGLYGFLMTVLAGLLAGLPGAGLSVLMRGLLQMAGLSVCIYIAVLPILSLCGSFPGLFTGGSVLAFAAGYCSMFLKSGPLRNIYPFLAACTAIGFDTAPYTNAAGGVSVPLAFASLGVLLLLCAGIVAFSKAPEGPRAKHEKRSLSLRPAQRERLKANGRA